MKNPNEPMTKAQKHIIFDKRLNKKVGGYTRDEISEYIKTKFNLDTVDLQKLTKEQAQAVITGFKPHKKEG